MQGRDGFGLEGRCRGSRLVSCCDAPAGRDLSVPLGDKQARSGFE